MNDYGAHQFFELAGWEHGDVFSADEGVWSALGARLKEYLLAQPAWHIHSPIPAGVHLLGDRISIGHDCVIEPGALIIGPAVIGDGVHIRTGAYVREHVLLGAGSLVGAHSEVKGSILFPGAKAPHQAYVGDSILGRDVNLGAGTILSNVKNIGREVSFRAGGEVIHTGLRKFGAVLGDGCKTGCNTVLNPGVLLGRGSVTYPNATLRSGYYPDRTLVKVRQQQKTVEMDKIDRRQ
jgi:NDP-sugar pyrophosphorylase family protein